MKERHIIYNAIRTPDGTLLISRHAHDYQAHKDTITNKIYAVDGGLEYIRYIGVINDCEIIVHYSDEIHAVVRELFEWGTYGKSGKDVRTFIKLKDMHEDHIRAILDDDFVAGWMTQLFLDELTYREIPYTWQ